MKFSDKTKMRLAVGTIVLMAATLVIITGVMLPKLNKQEKEIKDLLAKT